MTNNNKANPQKKKNCTIVQVLIFKVRIELNPLDPKVFML